MADRLVDHREPGFYVIDNEIIDVFGTKLGVYGISVYNVLVRFANAGGENAFPSYQTIADLLGISRPKVIDQVKLLLEYGLVKKTARKSASGDPTTNVYTLLNAKKVAGGGKQDLLPSKQDLLGGGKQDLLGGKPRLPDQDTVTNTHSDQDPPKKKRVKAAPHPMTQSIIDAYIKALGYTPSQETMTRHVAPTAKEIAKREITPEQIEQTYAIMADEEFWKDKTISLSKVLDRIEKTKATIRNRKEGEDGRSQDSQDDHLGGWTSEEIATVRRLRSEGKNDECGAYIRAAEERRRQARMSKV